jgi:short-subunit dehydrogenase
MLERGRGTIVNVASTSGFQPIPGNSTYAASKAFVLFHSEAIHEEARPHGVTVTAVSPGPVATGFQEVADPAFIDRMPKFTWTTAERVAADALLAAERGKRSVIPGGFVKRASFAPNRVTPSMVTLPVTKWVMSRELER